MARIESLGEAYDLTSFSKEETSMEKSERMASLQFSQLREFMERFWLAKEGIEESAIPSWNRLFDYQRCLYPVPLRLSCYSPVCLISKWLSFNGIGVLNFRNAEVHHRHRKVHGLSVRHAAGAEIQRSQADFVRCRCLRFPIGNARGLVQGIESWNGEKTKEKLLLVMFWDVYGVPK